MPNANDITEPRNQAPAIKIADDLISFTDKDSSTYKLV
jgi:hypothetical protein